MVTNEQQLGKYSLVVILVNIHW